MIIPVKCPTCGEVLANKYRYYLSEIENIRKKEIDFPSSSSSSLSTIKPDTYITPYLFANANPQKSAIKQVCDELNLKRCCRRVMMTHVDIE